MTTAKEQTEIYYVVHPLDDAPEEKRSPRGLPPMAMTPRVRVSLIVLRTYLIGIICLAVSHLAILFAAGLHHTR